MIELSPGKQYPSFFQYKRSMSQDTLAETSKRLKFLTLWVRNSNVCLERMKRSILACARHCNIKWKRLAFGSHQSICPASRVYKTRQHGPTAFSKELLTCTLHTENIILGILFFTSKRVLVSDLFYFMYLSKKNVTWWIIIYHISHSHHC